MGLISMQDGGTGDVFQISNSVGGTDLVYKASNGATLGPMPFSVVRARRPTISSSTAM
jgi:hypothetical protein